MCDGVCKVVFSISGLVVMQGRCCERMGAVWSWVVVINLSVGIRKGREKDVDDL